MSPLCHTAATAPACAVLLLQCSSMLPAAATACCHMWLQKLQSYISLWQLTWHGRFQKPRMKASHWMSDVALSNGKTVSSHMIKWGSDWGAWGKGWPSLAQTSVKEALIGPQVTACAGGAGQRCLLHSPCLTYSPLNLKSAKICAKMLKIFLCANKRIFQHLH